MDSDASRAGQGSLRTNFEHSRRINFDDSDASRAGQGSLRTNFEHSRRINFDLGSDIDMMGDRVSLPGRKTPCWRL